MLTKIAITIFKTEMFIRARSTPGLIQSRDYATYKEDLHCGSVLKTTFSSTEAIISHSHPLSSSAVVYVNDVVPAAEIEIKISIPIPVH